MALGDSVKFMASPVYLLLLFPLLPPPPGTAGWGAVPQGKLGVVGARQQQPQFLLQLLRQRAVASYVSEDNVRL